MATLDAPHRCPRCRRELIEETHCDSPTCPWRICGVDSLIVDAKGRTMGVSR